MIVPSCPWMSSASLQTRCESVVVKSLYCEDSIVGGSRRLPGFAERERITLSGDSWSQPPLSLCDPVLRTLEARAKSEKLTGYLLALLDRIPSDRYEVITPRNPQARGCQISLLVRNHPRALFKQLEANHVVGDFREPNVIRVAPVPLYNTFHEVWRFAEILKGNA